MPNAAKMTKKKFIPRRTLCVYHGFGNRCYRDNTQCCDCKEYLRNPDYSRTGYAPKQKKERCTLCGYYYGGKCTLRNYSHCTDCISDMELLTIPELQENVCYRSVKWYRKRFANNDILAYKVNGIWYATAEAVNAYLDSEREER